jgi:serine/threonine-protein kinase
MPPEQFTGAPIDGRADLFSLGVILFSLAAGEQPFLGETMTAVSYKVVHVDPIPPSKLNPAIPPGLEGVILKCLAKNPASRYQTGEELAQDLATLRVNPNASLLRTASSAAPAIDPNATLSAAASSISHPPVDTQSRAALPYATAPMPAAPAKKLSKSQRRETIVALAMLVLAAATAGAWFVVVHLHPPAPSVQKAVVTPPPPAPSNTPPPASIPVVQGIITPVSKTGAPAKPTPSNPAPGSAKPLTSAAKTTPPPATNPTPASTPAASSTPQPGTKPAKSTTPPAAAPIAAASDPHKLDPNANSKFKIALSHIPNGVPLTVEMNKAVYLRFISGDKTDLNNLFVPPGTQTFQVTAKNGGQQVVSNIVSSEFKAKKKKNFKIELQDQGNVPAGAAAPLSPGAQIFVSLSTPLF